MPTDETIIYTSRSPASTYQRCHRRRYLGYHFGGYGLSPVLPTQHLWTGSAVHTGIEALLNYHRKQSDDSKVVKGSWKLGLDAALTTFDSLWKPSIEFLESTNQTISLQRYLFIRNEHRALTEALVLCYYLRELPRLLERFKIRFVEKEIAIPLAAFSPGKTKVTSRNVKQYRIMFESRAEALLTDRTDGSNFIYSLKTCSEFGGFLEDSYREDLQCATEVYSTKQKIEERTGKTFVIRGIRFCFLSKSKAYNAEIGSYENSIKVKSHASPLIRGYRQVLPTGVNYAHSYSFPNSGNRSGMGRLGKGWSKFDVATEFGGGVFEWIKMLNRGQVQPECGDIIGSQVIVPMDYLTNDREVDSLMVSTRTQELKIAKDILRLEQEKEKYELEMPGDILRLELMDELFPQYRHSCTYPGQCEFRKICFQPEVADDPIGSGYYQKREAHHAGEKGQIKGRMEKEYGIE